MQINLTPEQIEIVESKARIKTLVASRRWGKSVLDGDYLAYTAWKYPESESWFVAPTFARSITMMQQMAKAYGKFIRKVCTQFPKPQLIWHNDSVTAFRSAENEASLRGWGLKLVCIDEAAYIKRAIFDAAILPMIADFKGTILLNSTYNGRNWFYDLCQKASKDTTGNYAFWKYPAKTCLCFRGEDGLKNLAFMKSTTRQLEWLQEFECEPIVSENSVFNPLDVDECIGGNALTESDKRTPFVIGLDIGRVKDLSVAITMRPNYEVVNEMVFPKGARYDDVCAKVAELSQKFDNCLVVADTTGMEARDARSGTRDSTYEFFKDRIPNMYPLLWNAQNKRNCIEHLHLQIQNHKLKIPAECHELISQLKVYQYSQGELSMYPSYGARGGEHDDATTALALCANAVLEHRVPLDNQPMTRYI